MFNSYVQLPKGISDFLSEINLHETLGGSPAMELMKPEQMSNGEPLKRT